MPYLLPLAIRYRDFLENLFEFPYLNEAPTHRRLDMSELELQSRWFAGELGREFQSQCGQKVHIIQFGYWNHSAGPDFTHCVVQVGEEKRKGCIELDRDVRDWERHSHGTNPAYNEVVLHLFVHAPQQRFYTRSENHQNIPQVLLDLNTLDNRPFVQQAEAKLGLCYKPLEKMPEARVESFLTAAAQYRLGLKSTRLHQSAEIHGRREALFQAFAEALGYRPNRFSMRVLAQRLSFRFLQKRSKEAEALLFGCAGFLDAGLKERPPETRIYLRQLWDDWWKYRAEFEQQEQGWKFAGIRPQNHPQRRLGALSSLLPRWRELESVLQSERFTPRSFRAFLQELKHEFWNWHYTLKSKQSRKPMALIGGTRVNELLANQVYPFLVPENVALWKAYTLLPAQLSNEKLRRATLRLFGEGPRGKAFTKKLYQQQALLQIYEDFCLEDESGCEECPFPEQLQSWVEVN